MTVVTISEALKLQQEGKVELYKTNVRKEADGTEIFQLSCKFLDDGGELGSTGTEQGGSRLIAWVKCPLNVNANDNVAFALAA